MRFGLLPLAVWPNVYLGTDAGTRSGASDRSPVATVLRRRTARAPPAPDRENWVRIRHSRPECLGRWKGPRTLSQCHDCSSAPRFGLLPGVLPAGDSSREVLHVGIAKLLGGLCRSLIGPALGSAAISNDARAFVLRQDTGQLVLGCSEIYGTRDMPLAPFVRPVRIEEDHLLG